MPGAESAGGGFSAGVVGSCGPVVAEQELCCHDVFRRWLFSSRWKFTPRCRPREPLDHLLKSTRSIAVEHVADIACHVETVHGAARNPQRVAILARRHFALEFEIDSAVE